MMNTTIIDVIWVKKLTNNATFNIITMAIVLNPRCLSLMCI